MQRIQDISGIESLRGSASWSLGDPVLGEECTYHGCVRDFIFDEYRFNSVVLSCPQHVETTPPGILCLMNMILDTMDLV